MAKTSYEWLDTLSAERPMRPTWAECILSASGRTCGIHPVRRGAQRRGLSGRTGAGVLPAHASAGQGIRTASALRDDVGPTTVRFPRRDELEGRDEP